MREADEHRARVIVMATESRASRQYGRPWHGTSEGHRSDQIAALKARNLGVRILYNEKPNKEKRPAA